MRGIALAGLLLCAQGCALTSPPPVPDPSGEREVLVMIRSEVRLRYQPGSAGLAEYGLAPAPSLERVAASIARDYGLERVSDWPMPSLGMHCFLMQVRDPESLDSTLKGLNGDQRVEWAQPTQRYRVLGHTDPYYPLQRGARSLRLDDLHRISIGKGVLVAVVDTGIETHHPDLDGQVSEVENFVGSGPYVPEVHGTAVAGVIAGRADNGIGIVGVAPSASLLGLRACWEPGDQSGAVCDSFSLAKALQFALRREVNVVNMSITGPADRLLSMLIDRAVEHGTTVVAAVDLRRPDGGFPASHPGVIAVTSEAASPAPGEHVIRAPGVDILTTRPPDSWGFFSGTSMAAAHVTGVIALVVARRPRLSRSVLANALARGNADAGGGTEVFDACAVFAAVLPAAGCTCCGDALKPLGPVPAWEGRSALP